MRKLLGAGCFVAGCVGDVGNQQAEDLEPPWEPNGPVVPSDCATPEEMFATRVWPQVFDVTCVNCHTAGGAASASRLQLVRSNEDPNFLAKNFDRVRSIAALHVAERGNRSLLELKPSGAVKHGGAVTIKPGGDQHQMLLDFIARLDGAVCETEEPFPYPFYDSITYVTPGTLLRRLALNFNGRLPTDAERAAIDTTALHPESLGARQRRLHRRIANNTVPSLGSACRGQPCPRRGRRSRPLVATSSQCTELHLFRADEQQVTRPDRSVHPIHIPSRALAAPS